MHNRTMRLYTPLLAVVLIAFLLASCSGPAPTTSDTKTPERIQSIHLELGYPLDADTTDDYLILRPQYAASFNHTLHVPNWVSWSLSNDWFGDVPRYDGRFLDELLLPAWFYHPRHDDYTNSGYDRGHMVRSEERTRTEEDNKATFYMSNILPQRPDLNRGVWLDFERYCETLCKDSLKQLFIVAGPVFIGQIHTSIGPDIAVPDSCFKLVVVLDYGQKLENVDATTRIIAVVMPNSDGVRSDDWTKYRSTVDHIEALTGYNFLDYVAPGIQTVIEAK